MFDRSSTIHPARKEDSETLLELAPNMWMKSLITLSFGWAKVQRCHKIAVPLRVTLFAKSQTTPVHQLPSPTPKLAPHAACREPLSHGVLSKQQRARSSHIHLRWCTIFQVYSAQYGRQRFTISSGGVSTGQERRGPPKPPACSFTWVGIEPY